MARVRGVQVAAAAGAVAVMGGVLVLRSRAAADVGLLPGLAQSGASPTWVDQLAVWNGTREAGAGLVLVGLTVLAVLGGTLLGAATRNAPRAVPVVAAAVLGAVLVAGGMLAVVGPDGPTTTCVTVSITKYELDPADPGVATSTCSTGQVLGGLALAVGLLLLAGARAFVAARRARTAA